MIEFSRHLNTAEHDVDARVGEDGVEQMGKLAVPVADHARSEVVVFEVHDEVLRGLYYPRRGGVRRGAQDVDSAAGVLDHREHVHPRSG
jgi:hypothetical protein